LIDFYSQNADQFAEQYETVDPEKIHGSWSHFIPETKSLILDVGAGSGRDAAWLANMGHEVFAVEPAKKLREKAQALHPLQNIHWISDTLPLLKKINNLGFKFDLILLNAVWIHIAPKNRERSFRKLSNLLKPGGKLVITLRHGPIKDKRVMYPVSSEELNSFANRFAMQVLLDTKTEDQLNRPDVSWSTIVLWIPDDGTGALPLLRHVIVNDAKSSTYKLALLRVLVRIADGAQGAIMDKNEEHVSLPFGLVALYWVKAFKPLILDKNFLQHPAGSKGLGFDKEAFRALRDVSPHDLNIGAQFKGKEAQNLTAAMRDARQIIKKMPAFYTTYPSSMDPVFPCESKRVQLKSSIRLDFDFFTKFGTFKIPRNLWDAMIRYACWIEPAIISEWESLMAGYDTKAGNKRTLDEYHIALSWLDKEHNTGEVRAVADQLKAKGKPLYCIWTGKRLSSEYEIDHCFPFAHWPNNDLWNLMPANKQANRNKLDKIPSAQLMNTAKERIAEWWDAAYSPDLYFNRFVTEAEASLPIVKSLKVENHLDRIFMGIQNQRIRLKTDQQIAEWNGLN
jgi:SAM-dependent methyltransferase